MNELVNPIRQIIQLLAGRGRKDVLEPLLDRGEVRQQRVKGIVERSEQFLATAKFRPLAHNGVTGIRGRRDHVAKAIADVRPGLSGLLEVTEDQLPGLGPSGTQRLLGRVHHLGEGLHLGRGVLRGLGQIHDGLGLILGIPLRDEVGLGVRAGELLQGLRQHVGGEPSALGQRLAERSVLLDHRVDVGAEVLGGTLQGVLELLAAHTGVDHRVPIHQRDAAGRDGLRQLVHRLRGLGRARTRHGREVGDALDGVDRRLKVHTGGREGADVAGHLGEVVDRLIGVGVQRVQRLVHLVDRRSLGLGVRQDRLDRVELGLVFGEALLDRLDHAVGDLTTGVHRGVRDLVDHRHEHHAHRGELAVDRVDPVLDALEVHLVGGLGDVVQTGSGVLELELLLEGIQGLGDAAGCGLELVGVKTHPYDTFVDSCHQRFTSFQASSAIASNTGRRAGLM